MNLQIESLQYTQGQSEWIFMRYCYSPSEVEFYQPSSSSLCCDNKLSKQDRFEISQSGSVRLHNKTKEPVKILILRLALHEQGNARENVTVST